MEEVVRSAESEAERVARCAPRAQMLAEAEAELARGEGIPWEEVEAWIDSWDTAEELPMPRARHLP